MYLMTVRFHHVSMDEISRSPITPANESFRWQSISCAVILPHARGRLSCSLLRRATRASTAPGSLSECMVSRPEHEVDGADQAQPGPQEIETKRLAHVEDRERHEHRQRNHFLDDLQLRQRQ